MSWFKRAPLPTIPEVPRVLPDWTAYSDKYGGVLEVHDAYFSKRMPPDERKEFEELYLSTPWATVYFLRECARNK